MSSWDSPFRDPIPLPGGGELRSLSDARAYILQLPEEIAKTPAWQTAAEALLVTVEHKGPVDFARMGLMVALYPRGEAVYDPNFKEPHWGRRKLKRDQ